MNLYSIKADKLFWSVLQSKGESGINLTCLLSTKAEGPLYQTVCQKFKIHCYPAHIHLKPFWKKVRRSANENDPLW
jgi:hypothetical protein